MIANYHTHTPLCNHAIGTETEYVEAAIAGGLQVLGFSDHTPQFFPGQYYSRMRMKPWELRDYIDTVLQLKEKYAGQLQIHLGLEVEFYPALFGELMDVLCDTPVEYLLLGQHWNGNEEGQLYNGHPTRDEKQLKTYCHQTMDAMNTGVFTYVAHPDILNYIGSDRVYKKLMRKLCQEAKSCNLPLELNLLGLREGRQYPNRLFWEIAAEEGCTAVLGSDAHCPDHIFQPDTENAALALVNQLGIRLLDTVELKDF